MRRMARRKEGSRHGFYRLIENAEAKQILWGKALETKRKQKKLILQRLVVLFSNLNVKLLEFSS